MIPLLAHPYWVPVISTLVLLMHHQERQHGAHQHKQAARVKQRRSRVLQERGNSYDKNLPVAAAAIPF